MVRELGSELAFESVYMIGDDLFILGKDWLGRTHFISEDNQDYMSFPVDEFNMLAVILQNSTFIGRL